MVCAALQAPLAYSRKPSANQAQTKRKPTRKSFLQGRPLHRKWRANHFASCANHLGWARKPFCQLRKPFGLGRANHFGSVSSHRDGLARSATPTALGAVRPLVRLPSHPPNPGRPCHGTFLGVHPRPHWRGRPAWLSCRRPSGRLHLDSQGLRIHWTQQGAPGRGGVNVRGATWERKRMRSP